MVGLGAGFAPGGGKAVGGDLGGDLRQAGAGGARLAEHTAGGIGERDAGGGAADIDAGEEG